MCPAYRLRVSANGRVEYEGRQFVKVKGRRTKKLTAEQVKALRDEVSKARYFQLRDAYASASDGCPSTWTDNPSAITSVRSGGHTKSINHYYGCRAKGEKSLLGDVYPAQLTRFEMRIDEIVQTEEWVGRPEDRVK